MMTFTSLDLGAPKDGLSWNKGCQERLGMQPKMSIIWESATLSQLTDFFGCMPDWVYLSGHFAKRSLYNNERVVPEVNIFFTDDGVEVTVGSETRYLRKSAGDFQLHQECTLLVLTGCSALEHPENIQLLRRLFENPVLLGYAGGTGWRISDAMFGGGFITNDFFARVKNKLAQNDRYAARNAWMEAAAWGYGGGDYGGIFRAVDQDGQEWLLSGKNIVKGPKHP